LARFLLKNVYNSYKPLSLIARSGEKKEVKAKIFVVESRDLEVIKRYKILYCTFKKITYLIKFQKPHTSVFFINLLF